MAELNAAHVATYLRGVSGAGWDAKEVTFELESPVRADEEHGKVTRAYFRASVNGVPFQVAVRPIKDKTVEAFKENVGSLKVKLPPGQDVVTCPETNGNTNWHTVPIGKTCHGWQIREVKP